MILVSSGELELRNHPGLTSCFFFARLLFETPFSHICPVDTTVYCTPVRWLWVQLNCQIIVIDRTIPQGF